MSKSIQSVLRRNIVVCILYAGIRSLLSEEGGVERGREGERGGERGREGGNLFRSSIPFRRTDSFLIGVILQNLGRDKVV